MTRRSARRSLRDRFGRWLGPTLTRRLIGALLVAVALLAALVLVQDQIDVRQQLAADPGVRQLGRQLAAGLDEIDDAAQAARLIAGHARHLHAQREWQRQHADADLLVGDVLLQLYDRSGTLLYASAHAEPIARVGVGEQVLAGRRHWTWRADGPRWSLRVAEPAIDNARLLGFAGWELSKQLLLALPLMVLPLWVAVRTGLTPLRRFTRRIEGLDTEATLAPLDMDLRYAELRPLGQAFDTLLRRLRERVEREQSFVHDAAHELRTPLAVIAAQAHVLVHARDEAARDEASTAMLDAVARSARLSQQLLDLASLDPRAAPVVEIVDVAAFSARLLAERNADARQRGLSLSLDAPDRVLARLDRVAMASILQNLLDNALRYVPAGGRIEVALSTDPRHGLRLSVADDGPGIAVEHRAQVFDRFWRGRHHDQPGSGLGLAIVRQAAARLGGRVTLEAGADGRGARFELHVPASVLGIP
ncbi:HAMP domain-containing sensor histidine kinase [Mitsuaria sp. GD03876]|uniref:sensor histidine kinase n=1 Tax=Mitsuaria sp. GD03876 TaxID=2975399 RepID=UPI002448A07F|nr:HAMP domain-containing sensor histidine kinase [Mitsuaria sp. GD03876]MDH0864550.1 HAMP domain-containing histidine kinase [Mitsuaria sp. GD03876]